MNTDLNSMQFNQDDFEYFEFDGTREGYKNLLNFLGKGKAEKVVASAYYGSNTDCSVETGISNVKFFTGLMNNVTFELCGMDVLFRHKYDNSIMFVTRRSSFELIKLKKSGEIPMS